MARRYKRITEELKERFLEEIAKGATVKDAAEKVGSKRESFFSLRARDPKFAERFQQAYVSGTDVLVAEAQRRAVEGWIEPSKFGDIRKYDSTLLMFLIKQRDPSFRENHRVEITGANGGAVPVEVSGGRATSLGDVIELAKQLGIGLAAGLAEGARERLDAGAAGDAVPAAEAVRPALGPGEG